MIKAKFSENPMDMLHQTSWLLYWSLVFSFTAKGTNGMFAALLADKQNFGEQYLNVIQLRSQHLMRHMVAAFLLGRSNYQPQPKAQLTKKEIHPLPVNALPKIALPIIVQEKEIYSDSFTQFTEALFEEFDFDLAIELADKMADEAC